HCGRPAAPRRAERPTHPSKKKHHHRLFRCLLVWGVLAVCTGASLSFSQSSFDTDPFAARFRERGGWEPKFKLPEKGGTIRITIEAGEPGGPQGKQTFVEEDLFTADAPPGKFVTIEYQDLKLTARSVHGSLKKKTVVAEGDVTFEQGASSMRGARLELDLVEKTGVLTDGRMDLEGGLHLKGVTLAKVGPRTFSLTDGVVTSCEGENPAWKFKVRSGSVTLEEFARLRNVTFLMGGVPLLWTPYLIWPALRERASGFLIPGLGYNSNRGGYFGVSYYWAINRSADATFSGDFYTKRYYGLGAEVRARPSDGTRFEGTYYIIKDPTIDAWRWQTQGALVSDDLGPKLRGVVTWLDLSDPTFFQDFNRNFSLSSTRSLKSEGFVTWNPDPFAMNLRISREEALGYGSGSVVSERLPTLEASLRPTPFFGQAVFVEASAQGGILRTDRGEALPSGTYDRFDLFPKVNVPLSLFPWLSLEGTAGVRLTTYGKSLSADGTSLEDVRYNREALSTEVSLTGPAFSRLFDGKLGPFTKFKHVIEPRIIWDYLAGRDNFAPTPLFDEIDSLVPTNVVRYSLLQHLLAKGSEGGSREIASFEVARQYFVRLPGEGTALGPALTAQRSSPWDFILRVNATSALNLDLRTTWDSHANQVTAASVTAVLTGTERTLALSLFDSHPVIIPAALDSGASAQLRVSGGMPILPKRLRFDVEANYDLTKGRMLESRSLLTVQAACFRILAEYRDLRTGDVPSRDFRVALTLKNVGSFLDFTGSLP
ncbi:MAG TPA: LPS assembly protein LptD, partial [Thermoanaerobaculia bacterium]|nr:LPS assembly protein LptD [Thermoanaerobaculia bacterium]